MKNFSYITLLFFIGFNPSIAQSNILKTVKQNPGEAISLCSKFKEMNSRGISASSPEVINVISKEKKLSPINAEILSMYVIGIHCPEVI
tara:strand:- start:7635 stop:7901 length:267 start_codon:yes stop_codon:yes gene_type:complete